MNKPLFILLTLVALASQAKATNVVEGQSVPADGPKIIELALAERCIYSIYKETRPAGPAKAYENHQHVVFFCLLCALLRTLHTRYWRSPKPPKTNPSTTKKSTETPKSRFAKCTRFLRNTLDKCWDWLWTLLSTPNLVVVGLNFLMSREDRSLSEPTTYKAYLPWLKIDGQSLAFKMSQGAMSTNLYAVVGYTFYKANHPLTAGLCSLLTLASLGAGTFLSQFKSPKLNLASTLLCLLYLWCIRKKPRAIFLPYLPYLLTPILVHFVPENIEIPWKINLWFPRRVLPIARYKAFEKSS